MKKGRFTEDQIIGVLKQHEAGRKVPELAREIARHSVFEGASDRLIDMIASMTSLSVPASSPGNRD
jgi:hypothetical protein